MTDSLEIFSRYYWKQGCFNHSNYHILVVGNPFHLWVRLRAVLCYHYSTNQPYSLIGAISRKRSFVRSYLWMVFVHLLLSIGLGIYAIVHNFKDAPKYIDECVSGSEDPSVLKSCEDGSKLFKGIMVAVFIFVWLLEIC